MRKSILIKLIGFAILFTGCDGAVKLKIQTVENSSVEGIFKADTIHNGNPVGNVKIELNFVVQSESEKGIDYYIETDSNGIAFDVFPVPPLKKKPKFRGFVTWAKEGYENDTLYFDHSSSDKRFAIINMEREK